MPALKILRYVDGKFLEIFLCMFVVCTIPLRVIDMHILWGISPLKIFQIFYSWIPVTWMNLNPIEYPLYPKLIQPFLSLCANSPIRKPFVHQFIQFNYSQIIVMTH